MKKLFKTKFILTVLSEKPFNNSVNLGDIIYEITDGICTGVIDRGVSRVIPNKKIIDEIKAQGSDPEFFGFIEGIGETEIKEFLNKFCTKVKKNEDSDYVELMMDGHFCIEYDKRQYYVPENNMLFTELDEKISEYLEENHRM